MPARHRAERFPIWTGQGLAVGPRSKRQYVENHGRYWRLLEQHRGNRIQPGGTGELCAARILERSRYAGCGYGWLGEGPQTLQTAAQRANPAYHPVESAFRAFDAGLRPVANGRLHAGPVNERRSPRGQSGSAWKAGGESRRSGRVRSVGAAAPGWNARGGACSTGACSRPVSRPVGKTWASRAANRSGTCGRERIWGPKRAPSPPRSRRMGPG